ncbi:MAG: flippase-like domain-containing protein [Muribaculaceae bacterium]|jgi:Predicted integral membrane protein|nr:flippase-like domain-containing protein [Muribaculaceae bacterium]
MAEATDMPQNAPTGHKHHRAREICGKVVKVLVPLAVTGVLVVWMLHKVNIGEVTRIMRGGVDYRYVLVMCVLVVLSHIIRGIRWGIQLRAAGIARMPWLAESVSIFGAYALNLVFPYLGEAWRCVYVSQRQKCKLSTVVGTDFGDRISDAVVIGLLILLAMWVAGPAIHEFMSNYEVGKWLEDTFGNGKIWMWTGAVTGAVALACMLTRRTAFMQGVLTSAKRIWTGFAVLFHMRGIGMYLVLTAGIWVCYFLQTYVCFFAFGFTRELISEPGMMWGLIPGLVVFVFGSISIAVPSNGGLGPWNIAVMFALSLYGVGNSEGAAFSLVCWSFQAITQVAAGLFSIGYMQWDRKRRRVATA